MKRTIRTKEEFEELMRDVDAALQSQEVPIHARELGAMAEVAQRLGVNVIGGPLRTAPIAGVYEGESLSGHILEWVRNRYGDRLKIAFANGYSVLLLRGDPWLLKFPVIYGKVTVVCDRNLSKQYPSWVMTRPGQAQEEAFFNLLKGIQDLPQGLASNLTDGELRDILNYFQFGHQFLNKLNSYCRGHELAMTALSDLNASARMATGDPSEYGQSRWESLQAAEKFLKYYVASKKASFPHVHELTTLAAQAVTLGLPEIEESVLRETQCSAEVRYSQQRQSVEDVVGGHRGAMRIGSMVINALYPE